MHAMSSRTPARLLGQLTTETTRAAISSSWMKEWPRFFWARFSEASSSGEQFSIGVPAVAYDFVRVVVCPKHFDALVLRGMVRARGRNRLAPLWSGIKLVHNLRLIIRQRHHALNQIQNFGEDCGQALSRSKVAQDGFAVL